LFDEFKKLLQGKDILQCAEVKHSKYRQWFRLVGLGYDLQVWRPDTRIPAIPCKFRIQNALFNGLKILLILAWQIFQRY
jgi:hypothetical protein